MKDAGERMAKSVSSLIEKDWKSDLEKVQQSQQSKLEMLERRISKLVEALDSTDRVLNTLQQERGTSVRDISVNGNAPGLDPSNPLYERKSELLAALFEANMELRQLQAARKNNDQD